MAVFINNKKPKGHAPVSELFQPANLEFTSKENRASTKKRKSSFKITFRRRKRYRSECSNHSNLLELTYNTELSAPQLLQRYKYCYSQLGIIQKHSERKGLLARRDARSGASQILFLQHSAPFLLLSDMFLQQKQCHLRRSHRGGNHKKSPQEYETTRPLISPPGTRRPEWKSLEKQGQRLGR